MTADKSIGLFCCHLEYLGIEFEKEELHIFIVGRQDSDLD
jgi:hypothetical protein